MSWALMPALIHMCKPPSADPTQALSGGARRPFLRCESFRLLGTILNTNARSENFLFHFPASKFLPDKIHLPKSSSIREHLEALMPELTRVLAIGLSSPELSKGKHVKTLLQYAKALISCMKSQDVSLSILRINGEDKAMDLKENLQTAMDSTNSDGVKAVAMQLLRMLDDGEETESAEKKQKNSKK